MSSDLVLSSPASWSTERLPVLFQAGPEGGRRFWEFFTVNIRNPNTRRAYFKAVARFSAWCEEKGLRDLSGVTPMHVAAYVEQLGPPAPNPPSNSTSPRSGCSSNGWSPGIPWRPTRPMRYGTEGSRRG